MGQDLMLLKDGAREFSLSTHGSGKEGRREGGRSEGGREDDEGEREKKNVRGRKERGLPERNIKTAHRRAFGRPGSPLPSVFPRLSRSAVRSSKLLARLGSGDNRTDHNVTQNGA
jgi:hypothetical protein